MRILVMTRFYRNGQTTHVLDLCAELLELGHRVLLVLANLNDLVYLQRLKASGIPHLLTARPEALRKQLARWGPELIHNHSAHTLPAALILGQELNIPTLTTVHYLDFEPKQLLQKQAAVILISREMREDFGDLQVPCFVVENGVRLPRLRPRAKRWRQRALLLAQTTPEKQENFHQLSQCLLQWGWEVVSAGGGSFPGVRYLGWVHDVEPLLRGADLVVGTGRAIREGMAACCAAFVLGRYCDGLVTPENVEKLQTANFSGRAYRAPFCPAAAAASLAQPQPAYFQELGRFGRRYALQHFSSRKMALAVEEIYRSILDRRAKLQG